MGGQLLRRKHFSKAAGAEREHLVFLPEGYDGDAAKKWPLLLFLHGMGERGDDVELVLTHGPLREAMRPERNLPFIMLGPQCPMLKIEDMRIPPLERIRRHETTTWEDMAPDVMELLDGALGEYRADPARVYLTGLSMGGFGSWFLAARYPGRWAAVAPVCGGGDPKEAQKIGATPTWAFHGEIDQAVPHAMSVDMVRALQAAGGNVRLASYPDLAHNCWDRVYGGEELYEWLLSHRRA